MGNSAVVLQTKCDGSMSIETSYLHLDLFLNSSIVI